MEHVVFWPSATGPAFERVASLADAAALVERLRNEQNVTDAEVHALTRVPLSFRTYYVVETGAGDAAAPLAAVTAPAAVAAVEAPEPAPAFGSAFASPFPVEDDVPPLSAEVPSVVPDPISPFSKIADAETEAPALHSVADVEGEPAEDADPDEHTAPVLVAVPALEEGDAEGSAARSLGLFA